MYSGRFLATKLKRVNQMKKNWTMATETCVRFFVRLRLSSFFSPWRFMWRSKKKLFILHSSGCRRARPNPIFPSAECLYITIECEWMNILYMRVSVSFNGLSNSFSSQPDTSTAVLMCSVVLKCAVVGLAVFFRYSSAYFITLVKWLICFSCMRTFHIIGIRLWHWIFHCFFFNIAFQFFSPSLTALNRITMKNGLVSHIYWGRLTRFACSALFVWIIITEAFSHIESCVWILFEMKMEIKLHLEQI